MLVKKTLKAKHCWNKTASVEHSIVVHFSCWHSHRRSRLLFNKMLNCWNKIKAKHVEFKVAQYMLSKTACWQKSRKSTCWSGMLKIHNLWHKKDVVEILHVEVSHGSTRPLDVCKVCAGCIYCLLKQLWNIVCCFVRSLRVDSVGCAVQHCVGDVAVCLLKRTS